MVIELDLTTTTKGKGTCCVGESNGQDRTDVETDIGIDDVLRFDNANFSSVVSESQSESLPELLPKSGSLNLHCNIFQNLLHTVNDIYKTNLCSWCIYRKKILFFMYS